MPRYRRVNHDLKDLRERKYRLRAGGPRGVVKFIPNSDSEFAHMARNFASHIETHAERLPLSNEQVANLSAAVAGFRDALTQTMRARSCGPFATMQKNEARKKAEQIIREVANLLRPHQSLTAEDRFALNLNERPKKTKRRECPQIAPVLLFRGSTSPHAGARHILQFGNDFDRASTAKPHGAARLELFVELVPPTEPIPSHPGERSGGRLWYLRSFTTSRFEVEYPVLTDEMGRSVPMRVCYWGRWADACGGVGPFSQTCVARVEGDQLALPPGGAAVPVFDARHRRQNVVKQLPGQLHSVVVVESGARFALPEHAIQSAA